MSECFCACVCCVPFGAISYIFVLNSLELLANIDIDLLSGFTSIKLSECIESSPENRTKRSVNIKCIVYH